MSAESEANTVGGKHEVWRIHEFGGIKSLKLESIPIPIIKYPNEVVIEVKAASVNPLDILMLDGYGRTLLNILRLFQPALPLTVGRDFSGIIIDKGSSSKYQIGDEVYGFVPVQLQGSFAQKIVIDSSCILLKPKHLNFVESASLVYAAMTAWSALFPYLTPNYKGDDKILVLGGSGGVGTVAIQLLKSQGYTVYTTCSANAVPLVTQLGADKAFDYRDKDFNKNVEEGGKYKLILDGANTGIDNIPSSWKFEIYVTLNSPLLNNTDNRGVVLGLLTSGYEFARANLSRFRAGNRVKWGFFTPSSKGFEFLNSLIVDKKIEPVVQKTFGFNDLPKSFEAFREGHTRGKIVVDYTI